MILSFALLFFIGITGVTGLRNDYVTSIKPRAKTNWGSWGRDVWCPNGYYAYGFQLKVEGRQGRGDDTAVNGIRIHCSFSCFGHVVTAHLTPSGGPWGSWEQSHYCQKNSFLKAVSIKSEPPQRGGDDTAANNFLFSCQALNGTHYDPHPLLGKGMPWGTWSSRVNCPDNTYICGLRTKVEGKQGRGDDTTLNEARFHCCRFKNACPF